MNKNSGKEEQGKPNLNTMKPNITLTHTSTVIFVLYMFIKILFIEIFHYAIIWRFSWNHYNMLIWCSSKKQTNKKRNAFFVMDHVKFKRTDCIYNIQLFQHKCLYFNFDYFNVYFILSFNVCNTVGQVHIMCLYSWSNIIQFHVCLFVLFLNGRSFSHLKMPLVAVQLQNMHLL